MPALVVVDVQAAFVRGSSAVPDAARLLTAVEILLARARSAGAVVVHLQNDGAHGAPDEPGTPGWQLVLEPAAGEHVLRKRHDDGFEGTDLAAILEHHGVETVVLCGLQSEMCVAATARGALTRGIRVVLPREAHGTYDIPADGSGGVGVPAAQVARVVEWSLGDEIIVVDEASTVDFSQSWK